MAALLYGLCVVIGALPAMRDFFGLLPLTAARVVLVVATALLWAVVLRQVWRWRLFDRFLGIDLR